MSEQEGSEAYARAGVDTRAGQAFVSSIKASVESTYSLPPGKVLSTLRGFAGLFDVSYLKEFQEPVLVSGTDGVGTKLKLASLFDRHDTVGIDLVAMCANDVLVTGARPLFFLDYIACGKLEQNRMQAILSGIVEGCKEARCALLGGETAEHPGVMPDDDYDLAGFMVGAVEKSELLTGSSIAPGDLLIGLPSSGIHSNGMSLVRKIYMGDSGSAGSLSADVKEFLQNEILLRPTIIYEKLLRPVLAARRSAGEPIIKAMAHITGGGFFENIPRILPQGLGAEIALNSWPVPSLFKRIQQDGNLSLDEMLHVFNCGIGMLLVVDHAVAVRLKEFLPGDFFEIGRVLPGFAGLRLV